MEREVLKGFSWTAAGLTIQYKIRWQTNTPVRGEKNTFYFLSLTKPSVELLMFLMQPVSQ